MSTRNISIIICTRDREDDLRDTLRAMEDLVVPDDCRAELVVVDNNSKDHTKDVIHAANLKQLPVRYVLAAEPGQVYARNAGLEASRGEIIVFTDDDVRPDKMWLYHITRPLVEEGADIVTGTIRIASHLQRFWMADLHRVWLAIRELSDSEPVHTVAGANFAFRRSILDKVPRFDPELGPGRLGFWDDTLFSLQVEQAGFKILAAPHAVVEHHFAPNRLLRSSFLRRAEGEGRCNAYVSWHWGHDPIDSRAKYRALKKKIKLSILRVLRWRECRSEEGCPEWELRLVLSAAYFNQYWMEQRRPRAYAQHGLLKLAPPR